MAVLTLPILLGLGLVNSLIMGFIAQRLLGLRLGFVRLVATGVVALAVLPTLMVTFLGGSFETGHYVPSNSGWAAFWLVLLALVCTVLTSMIFIVVVEAFVPLGSLPPAMVWGRGLKGRLKRARRYWQIVGIAMRHGLWPYLRGSRDRELDIPSGRARLGRSLRTTLSSGGVTFVKIGQLLATRRDLLPSEITAALATLQDQADPVPWPAVEAVLTSELGGPVDEVFAEFDRTPMAAASVGQVHLARLRDGSEVVVKVQRPDIRSTVERDLDIAARLAARLENGTRWGRGMGMRALAAGLATAIREELDYRVEADNILAAGRAPSHHPDVAIPEPHPRPVHRAGAGDDPAARHAHRQGRRRHRPPRPRSHEPRHHPCSTA